MHVVGVGGGEDHAQEERANSLDEQTRKVQKRLGRIRRMFRLRDDDDRMSHPEAIWKHGSVYDTCLLSQASPIRHIIATKYTIKLLRSLEPCIVTIARYGVLFGFRQRLENTNVGVVLLNIMVLWQICFLSRMILSAKR